MFSRAWHCSCILEARVQVESPGSVGSRAGRAEIRPHNKREREEDMRKLFVAVLSVVVALSLSPAVGTAQTSCPAEVAQAKDMLSKKTASVKPGDVQAPRSLAGARSSDATQAPRGSQEVQAPRGKQEVQAPRSLAGARSSDATQAPRGSQEVQAPRGKQEVQAPRGSQEVQAPRGSQEVQAPRDRTS